MKEHTISLILTLDDFKVSMGREPKDVAEFEDWASLLEKGLLNGYIDWDILYECAQDAMDDLKKEKQAAGTDGNVLTDDRGWSSATRR